MIFKAYAGVSGGDIAIIFSNIIVGLLHVLAIAIFNKYSGYKISGGIFSVVLFQMLELIIFVNCGYDINEWIKSF